MKINQCHDLSADEHLLVKSAKSLETLHSLDGAQQTIQRIPRGYRTIIQLSCSISHLLVKDYTLNHKVFTGVQYSHSTILYRHMCGYCRQRIKENSYIGFPNGQGKALKLSHGTDGPFKNNTAIYSGAPQQVQIHTLIGIKVIHHIDLNDSDTLKKKEIFTSSWKKQQSKTETTPKDKALINIICGRLIYLTFQSRFPYVLNRKILWFARIQTVIIGKKLTSYFLEQSKYLFK